MFLHKFMGNIFDRLKEERDRLGLNQTQLAESIDIGRNTVVNWERGASSPSAQQLAVMSAHGFDAMYIVTGERQGERQGLDPMRRAVLDSFNRCSPEKQIEAVQYMALLAAGVAPSPSSTAKTVTKASVSKSAFGLAIGNVVGKKK